MSPWLFNLFMDNIVTEAMEKFVGGVQLEETMIQLLLFADDLMLVAEKMKCGEESKLLDGETEDAGHAIGGRLRC